MLPMRKPGGAACLAVLSLSLLGCRLDVVGPAEVYDARVPIAYYRKTLDFTLGTAGFTPPVQSRAYASGLPTPAPLNCPKSSCMGWPVVEVADAP